MTATNLLHRSEYDAWRWAEELFSQRNYTGAAKVLEQIIEESDSSEVQGQVHELLARSYYHSARLGPAEREARAILEREPANGYVALLLSRTLERSGDKDGAERYRKRAAALGEEA